MPRLENMHRGRGGRMKLLLGGARRAISPCSTEQIHSKSVLLELAIQHLGPPTEIYEDRLVANGTNPLKGGRSVFTTRKNSLQIGVCVDPDPWDDVFALLGP